MATALLLLLSSCTRFRCVCLVPANAAKTARIGNTDRAVRDAVRHRRRQRTAATRSMLPERLVSSSVRRTMSTIRATPTTASASPQRQLRVKSRRVSRVSAAPGRDEARHGERVQAVEEVSRFRSSTSVSGDGMANANGKQATSQAQCLRCLDSGSRTGSYRLRGDRRRRLRSCQLQAYFVPPLAPQSVSDAGARAIGGGRDSTAVVTPGSGTASSRRRSASSAARCGRQQQRARQANERRLRPRRARRGLRSGRFGRSSDERRFFDVQAEVSGEPLTRRLGCGPSPASGAGGSSARTVTVVPRLAGSSERIACATAVAAASLGART